MNETNKEILDILKVMASCHPELRFQQLLQYVGAIELKPAMDLIGDGMCTPDRFYEPSAETLSRMKRTLKEIR